MKIINLIKELDKLFPRSLGCDWDNDGVMCAPDTEREANRVLCVLDVTDAVVRYAQNNGFDVIISHHPLIFKPLPSLFEDNPAQKTIIDIIKSNITVLSYHTRLDAANGGVADLLCELAGLTDVETIDGAGENILRIGNTEKTDLISFSSRIKSALDCPFILASDQVNAVSRVAVCPGDGKDFVSLAKSLGADTYLTGRLSYNIMCDAQKIGLNLIEAGHYYTERNIAHRLADTVRNLCGAHVEVYESLNINII